jgi:hypothetical protein
LTEFAYPQICLAEFGEFQQALRRVTMGVLASQEQTRPLRVGSLRDEVAEVMMSDHLITRRLDLRTGILVAFVAVIVLAVFAASRLFAAHAFSPSVCVSSMMVEIGQEAVINPETCLP